MHVPTRGIRVVDVVRVSLALVLVANLGRIPLLFVDNKDAPVLVTDLGVMAVLVAGAAVALRGRVLRLDSIAIIALLFAGVGALSAMLAVPRFGLSPFEFAISFAYLVRWVFYFGLYVVVINYVRRGDVPSVWNAFEGMVLVFAAFGIFQSAFLPGFAQIVYPDSELYVDWDPQGRRLVSTFLDPNFAGALIFMALLVYFSWIALGVKVARWKVVLLAVALVLTISRSSVIGLMAGGLMILTVRGLSKRLLRVGGLLLLLALPFTPFIFTFAADYGKFTIGPSALARVAMWVRGLEIFADNPILGVGFNTYGFVQESYGYQAVGRASYTLDGGLLFVAVMTGTVGLTLYITMIGLFLARCRRTWREVSRDAYERGLALGVGAATVALLVHSVFLNSLLLPLLMGPLWVLWGLVYLMRQPFGTPTLARSADARAPRLAVLPRAG